MDIEINFADSSYQEYCWYHMNYYEDKFDYEANCIKYFSDLQSCQNYSPAVYQCVMPVLCSTKWY